MNVAYIGKIIDLQPIKNRDRILAATVVCGKAGKWQGVVVKDQFSIGDLCEVYLQDAQLPVDDPRFAFMAEKKYRVRMMRFAGVPSECLIMPLSPYTSFITDIGATIDNIYNIIKYEKPVDANIGGVIAGNFPHFIPRTDESNFQTARHLIEALWGKSWYATTKCDGSSGTTYWYENHFGVCSRNNELCDTPENAFWQIAHRYNLPAQKFDSTALQWELIGPKVQGNPMGFKVLTPQLFNVYYINDRRYGNYEELQQYADFLHMPIVELTDWGDSFDLSDDVMRKVAEGLYPNGKQREGVVIRPKTEERVMGDRLSFKVINLLYKE